MSKYGTVTVGYATLLGERLLAHRCAVATSPGHHGPRGFTLTEMLMVIATIAVLAVIVLGACEAVCDEANKVRCAARLKGLGLAIYAYARSSDGRLPDTGAASPLGGPVPADGFHFRDDWDSRGTALWPQERRTGNAGNLYLLIRLGLAEPRDFICPASGDRAAFGPFCQGRFGFLAFQRGSLSLTAEEKEFLRLNATRHCSYSYQNMLGHPGNDCRVADPNAGGVHLESSPPDLAILADHNPYTQLSGACRPGLDPAADPQANSLNHAGRGQNVLYVDLSVAWHTTPLCGARLPDGTRDNIYRPAAGGVTDPQNVPRHARDSYLVP